MRRTLKMDLSYVADSRALAERLQELLDAVAILETTDNIQWNAASGEATFTVYTYPKPQEAHDNGNED